MSDAPSISPFHFFDSVNAYQKTAALKAAMELSLFTAIGSQSATAEEVATLCQSPVRGIRILCDYLTIIGFLIKAEDRYSLTPESAAFLDEKSPMYVGAATQFLLAPELTDPFHHLADTIRSGRVHASEKGTTAPDHPVWLEFARAMGPLMTPCAHGTAALVSLDPARDTKVLDISASHGTYGIVVAQRNPRTHLVALDWAAVLELTKENATAAGLSDRFSTIAGDAFTVDLGSDYDVVLVPNFLHHFSIADCTRFLSRVHAALRPGGQVAIVEFVPNDDRVSPPASATFSLVMLGSTPEGDAYTFTEYNRMLTEAGFHSASLHPLAPTPQSAIIATA